MIDARGLSCPTPVLLAQREVAANAPAELTILVDNMAAVQNLGRFARSRGYESKTDDFEGDYKVMLKKK